MGRENSDSGIMLEVERILKRNVQARNSDKALILDYMIENSSIKNLSEKTKMLLFKAFFEVPPFETITRRRRELQSKGFYPATAKTVGARKAAEKAMRIHYR